MRIVKIIKSDYFLKLYILHRFYFLLNTLNISLTSIKLLYPKLIILSKIDRKSVSASYLISYSPFMLRKLMISVITLIDGLIVDNWNNQLVLLHTVELLMCKIATLTSRWIAIESRDSSTVRTPPHPDLSRILFSFLSLPAFLSFFYRLFFAFSVKSERRDGSRMRIS